MRYLVLLPILHQYCSIHLQCPLTCISPALSNTSNGEYHLCDPVNTRCPAAHDAAALRSRECIEIELLNPILGQL